MGCFSFICKRCGKGILSNSFRGERVELFLLKNGKVVEQMSGEYDSYGRVFDSKMESIEWEMDRDDVCDLMFDEDRSNGVAAIHSSCWESEIPCERSYNDPDQGWGKDGELFNNSNKDLEFNERR